MDVRRLARGAARTAVGLGCEPGAYAALVQLSSALLILGGLVALVAGGEVLVRGAGGLARSAGMPPLLVGLTVVAFATSAPEFAVTLNSALGGTPGLAVGNVVGSNIANVLLVLGVSAIILPLAVHNQVVRRDIPVMVFASVVALLLSLDLRLSRSDGLILLAILVAYVVLTERAPHGQGHEFSPSHPDSGWDGRRSDRAEGRRRGPWRPHRP